MFVGILVTN